MTKKLSIAGFGVAVFVLLCEVVSVSLDYWMYMDKAGLVAYAGLWKSCKEFQGVRTCTSDGATDAVIAVQVMVVFSIVSTLAAIVCGALKMFLIKEKKPLTFAAAGSMTATGLFLMVAVAVYTSEIYAPRKSTFDLHAGFVLCTIAWLSSWVSALLFGLTVINEK